MVSNVLAGLILAIIGLTLIQNFREFLYKQTSIALPDKPRQILYAIAWVIFFVLIINSSISETNKANESAQQAQEMLRQAMQKQKQAEIDKRNNYFIDNKMVIIKEIEQLNQDKKYIDGIKQANQYIQTKDKELLALKKEMEDKQGEIEKAVNTKNILNELKKLSASEVNKNYELYQKLVQLHPNNQEYNSKMKVYADKVAKIEAKNAAENIFYGTAPIASGWDGSYNEVERYLKTVMNDPSSLEMDKCSSVFKVKKGWAVWCSYRGKNGFGGMVLNSNWFIIRQNQVVAIEDTNAYSLK
jgi:hypothetical protein